MTSELLKRGIIQKEGKISTLFESLMGSKTFMQVKYQLPHKYITSYWEKYLNSGLQDNSVNGGIFELIIYTLLYRENILPFYTQAKVAFVPNIEFDTILYSNNFPICLSMKTSLRERYKQADLEAIALKYVHRRARSFLLTLNSKEANSVRSKIPSGEIIGLDDVVDCNTTQIDTLIQQLKNYEFKKSSSIEIVTGNLIMR